MKTHSALSLIRAAPLVLVFAASVACALPWPSAGPRDMGGVYMILAVKADAAAVEQAVAQASEVITSRCGALGVITGSFTKQQAEDVALTLKSGSLPTPIEVLEEGRYKP